MLLSFFLFFLGLTAGSFLNVLAMRIPRGETVLRGRSRCESCGATLGWTELIPVLSFLRQRARCRRCRCRISAQYPIVELATGALFILAPAAAREAGGIFGAVPAGAREWFAVGYALFVFSVLVAVFIADLRYFLIPDKIILPAIAASLGAILANGLSGCRLPLANCQFADAAASLAGAAFFLALVLVSRGSWMGLGDVKLAVFMGLALGIAKLLVALVTAFFLGSLVGIALIILRKKTLASEVPFGTFLAAASVFALLRGEWVLRAANLAPFRW